MFELFKKCILRELALKEIDLQDYDYKQSENYLKIKDTRILGFNGHSMSLEAFIERYLLSPVEVSDTYQSSFNMGSQYEFCDDECEDIEVAKAILSLNQVSRNDIDAEAEDFVKRFYRTGGLIARLKTFLDFDLEAFEKKIGSISMRDAKSCIYFICWKTSIFQRPIYWNCLANLQWKVSTTRLWVRRLITE